MIDGRKIAIGFGILALLGILAFGGYRAYGWFVAASADMKAVGEPALTALAEQEWDLAALKPFASPPLQGWMSSTDTKMAFAPLRRLGKVKQFLGVRGFNQNYQNGLWTATFEERVQFEGGDASAHFMLRRVDGAWRPDGLNVTPSAS